MATRITRWLDRIDPEVRRRVKGLRLVTAYGIAAVLGALHRAALPWRKYGFRTQQLYLLSSAAAPPPTSLLAGGTLCSTCAYSQWGYWGGEVASNFGGSRVEFLGRKAANRHTSVYRLSYRHG